MAQVKINADLEALFDTLGDLGDSPLNIRRLSGDLYRAVFAIEGSDLRLTADLNMADTDEPVFQALTVGSPETGDVLSLSDIRLTGAQFDAGFDAIFAGADRIEGSARGDRLGGYGGNDTILGGAGGDRLSGGAGADRLLGGRGADRLDGGRGRDRLDTGEDAAADTFVLARAGHSAIGARRDVLVNFDRGEDVIDLRALDPRPGSDADDAFGWGGRTPGNRQVWWVATEAGVLLRGDLGGDGDARPDFELLLSGLDALGRADVLL